MKHNKSGTPLFHGSDYAFWSIRMRYFLEAQGIEQWKIVENGYKVPKNPLTNAYDLTKYNINLKSRNHILNALDKSIFHQDHALYICKANMVQARNYL